MLHVWQRMGIDTQSKGCARMTDLLRDNLGHREPRQTNCDGRIHGIQGSEFRVEKFSTGIASLLQPVGDVGWLDFVTPVAISHSHCKYMAIIFIHLKDWP